MNNFKIPTYKCIKNVKAFKIKSMQKINDNDNDKDNKFILALKGDEQCVVYVKEDYVKKHNPQIGGYYVLYKDDYESWSPAEAFEEGYVKTEEN